MSILILAGVQKTSLMVEPSIPTKRNAKAIQNGSEAAGKILRGP